MEQQPGPVNRAPYNPAPLPGMARLWAWEAFAHGAEAVCYFRWRQAPFAQEQMHSGLLRPDSAPAPAYHEAAQVAEELAEMPEVADTAAPVALIFDYAAVWAWDVQPQGAGCDCFQLVFETYRGLRRLGLSVDILPPDTADLSGYGVVLAPGLMTVAEPLLRAVRSFGGTAILGPRANAKTAEMSIPVPLPPDLPGLDVLVAGVETLRPDMPVPVQGGGAIRHWREMLEGDAEAVELDDDGAPVMVRQGKLHYLGGWPDEEFLDRILRRALDAEGIAATDMPGSLRQRQSGDTRFLFNYGADPVMFEGHQIPPAGVLWQAG